MEIIILITKSPCIIVGKDMGHWKEFISHLSKYEHSHKEYLDDVYYGTHWKLQPEYEK